MRRKKLLEFIDWFEAGRRPYVQDDCDHCIAAHVQRWLRMHPTAIGRGGIDTLSTTFGLYDSEAITLFGVPYIKAAVTRKMAVAMLRHFAWTGVVDWRRAARVTS